MKQVKIASGVVEFLFFTACQYRLKIGRRFFPGNYVDLDPSKAGIFKPAMQVAFRKTGPTITVQFCRFHEVVFE